MAISWLVVLVVCATSIAIQDRPTTTSEFSKKPQVVCALNECLVDGRQCFPARVCSQIERCVSDGLPADVCQKRFAPMSGDPEAAVPSFSPSDAVKPSARSDNVLGVTNVREDGKEDLKYLVKSADGFSGKLDKKNDKHGNEGHEHKELKGEEHGNERFEYDNEKVSNEDHKKDGLMGKQHESDKEIQKNGRQQDTKHGDERHGNINGHSKGDGESEEQTIKSQEEEKRQGEEHKDNSDNEEDEKRHEYRGHEHSTLTTERKEHIQEHPTVKYNFSALESGSIIRRILRPIRIIVIRFHQHFIKKRRAADKQEEEHLHSTVDKIKRSVEQHDVENERNVDKEEEKLTLGDKSAEQYQPDIQKAMSSVEEQHNVMVKRAKDIPAEDSEKDEGSFSTVEDLERDNDIIDSEIDKVESKSLDSSVIKNLLSDVDQTNDSADSNALEATSDVDDSADSNALEATSDVDDSADSNALEATSDVDDEKDSSEDDDDDDEEEDAVKSRKKRRSRGRKVRKKVYRRRRPKHKKVLKKSHKKAAAKKAAARKAAARKAAARKAAARKAAARKAAARKAAARKAAARKAAMKKGTRKFGKKAAVKKGARKFGRKSVGKIGKKTFLNGVKQSSVMCQNKKAPKPNLAIKSKRKGPKKNWRVKPNSHAKSKGKIHKSAVVDAFKSAKDRMIKKAKEFQAKVNPKGKFHNLLKSIRSRKDKMEKIKNGCKSAGCKGATEGTLRKVQNILGKIFKKLGVARVPRSVVERVASKVAAINTKQ
ncbi:glutamic acid-rich protein-like isoform X2 [Corticium candelabrum]|uniref:glutamic acid-rich protein-like isoform X2 n=1 Tax=Corticium candelabrum TaxID=121492 RepID=UPI002E2EB34A|nr:glutamic acid-rich protein-like isoform X2 [Corticium candelabrum]